MVKVKFQADKVIISKDADEEIKQIIIYTDRISAINMDKIGRLHVSVRKHERT